MVKIQSHSSGMLTLLGTIVLVSLFAYLMGGWHFSSLAYQNPAGTILSLIVIDTVLAWIFGVMLKSLSHDTPASAVADVINSMKGKHNFATFFFAAFMEEVYARWLFLGILPTVLNPTTFVWWTLLILGNSSWALIHLMNFEKKDRRIIWILPQFIGGLIFSLVYVKFGFLAAVYCHLGSNALLLCVHKVEDVTEKDILPASYCVLVSGLSLALMSLGNNFSNFEIGKLLEQLSVGDSSLDRLEIIDWISITILTTFLLKSLTTLLMYDAGMVEPNGNSKDLPKLRELALGFVLLTIIISLVFTLARLFCPSNGMIALLCAMLVCCLFRTNSGSGTARNFWLTMPKFLVLAMAFEYGGIFALTASIFAIILLYIPLLFLERRSV